MKQTTAALFPVKEMTPAEALMTVAVLAMDADDCYALSEMQRLRAMSWLHPFFRDTESTVDHFIGLRFADLRTRGRAVLLEDSFGALSPRLRETAYAWAVELVHADGSVNGKEHDFLGELARRFAVPGPLARKVQAVTAIRRRTA